MKHHRYLLNAATIGLFSALAANPALAADDAKNGNEIAIEAQGSFAGFRLQQSNETLVSTDITFEPTAFRAPRSLSGALLPATPELIVRNDVGIAGSVDRANTLPSVVQMFIQNNVTGGVFFNCTGTLINPRTVLTAAHCLNSESSEAYGLPGEAATTVLIGTGVDTRPRLINYLSSGRTNGYAAGGVARSTDVVIHASSNLDNGALPFPWADIAFVALDAPITDIPALPILLTPLDQLTHVLVAGYGTRGTGDNGAAGIDTLRRVGENMLGAIATPADFIDSIFTAFAPTALTFGIETQPYYFIDFDDPTRTAADKAGCEFDGFGISCLNVDAVKAIDWFPGDALPREAGTAPGDSGSPLIADQIAAFPLVTAVLSGGYDFFGLGNIYGDVSFYNPLFPFFEFITENTPYKYVSAKAGDGVWSDPTRWTQDLDPGFFISDGNGGFINGVPGGSEPGVYAAGPKLGNILGADISDNEEIVSPLLPPEGTPNFGANTPNSSVLLGPGSTGFVPNNTDGTPGIAFSNPAQYFDVLLINPGTTTVDIDVEIDRLTVDGKNTGFRLPQGLTLTSIIGVEQYAGLSTINGQLNAGNVLLFGGTVEGTGSVNTNAFFNVSGIVAPGGVDQIGNFTINGDYVQTSAGALLVDLKRTGNGLTGDLLTVTGDASLAGSLLLKPTGQITAKFGAEYTVLTANSVLGNFDDVALLTRSPVLFAASRVDGSNVVVEIGARPIAQLVGPQSDLASLATALDNLRFGGRYNQFAQLFGAIDSAGFDVFGQTLAGLTPTNGFQQSMVANSFAQRFTGQVSQRTLALRGGNVAAAGFSSAGSASFAQAGTAPGEASKLGFFGSVSGSYLTMARNDRNTGNSALQEFAFNEAGEITLGTDLRLSDSVSIGFAVSNVRDSAGTAGGLRPNENESVSGAVYAATGFGQGFADMYVGFSNQQFGMERPSQGNLQGQFGSAASNARGNQSFAGVRVGYAMEPARNLTLGPVASIDYVGSNLGAFREYGAGQFGLDVRARNFTSVGAKLGAMASLDMKLGRTGTLTAFGSVAYARELADRSDIVTASFLGAADQTFSIERQLDPQWVSVNAGAALSLSDKLSTRLSLTSDMGRGPLTNNQASMQLNWQF